jgi:hypothetical protein
MYADARAFYADVAEFGCKHFKPKQTKTNGDSIRSMMDEELASLLSPVCVHGLVIEHGECDKEDKSFCVDCWLDWLKAEVG